MSRVSYTMVHAADVKCYYCGHISGQVLGPRRKAISPTNFVPRSGYTGPKPGSGGKLRCERCNGPVFLEDAAPIAVKHVTPSAPRQKAA